MPLGSVTIMRPGYVEICISPGDEEKMEKIQGKNVEKYAKKIAQVMPADSGPPVAFT